MQICRSESEAWQAKRGASQASSRVLAFSDSTNDGAWQNFGALRSRKAKTFRTADTKEHQKWQILGIPIRTTILAKLGILDSENGGAE